MVMGSSSPCTPWRAAAVAALCVGAAAQNTTSSSDMTFPPTPVPPVFHQHFEMCFVMTDAACPGKSDCTMNGEKVKGLKAAFKAVAQTNAGVELHPTCVQSSNCKEGCEVTFEAKAAISKSQMTQLDTCSGNPEASGCGALREEGLQISAAADSYVNGADGDDDGDSMAVWIILAVLLTCAAMGILGFLLVRKMRREQLQNEGMQHLVGDLASQDQEAMRANERGMEMQQRCDDSDDGNMSPADLVKIHIDCADDSAPPPPPMMNMNVSRQGSQPPSRGHTPALYPGVSPTVTPMKARQRSNMEVVAL